MTEMQPHAKATEMVRKLKGFYIHLFLFVLVNAGLFTVNIIRKPDKLWFYWVLIGWGIGVLLHAAIVFLDGVGKNWEKRKINKLLMDNDKNLTARP